MTLISPRSQSLIMLSTTFNSQRSGSFFLIISVQQTCCHSGMYYTAHVAVVTMVCYSVSVWRTRCMCPLSTWAWLQPTTTSTTPPSVCHGQPVKYYLLDLTQNIINRNWSPEINNVDDSSTILLQVVVRVLIHSHYISKKVYQNYSISGLLMLHFCFTV